MAFSGFHVGPTLSLQTVVCVMLLLLLQPAVKKIKVFTFKDAFLALWWFLMFFQAFPIYGKLHFHFLSYFWHTLSTISIWSMHLDALWVMCCWVCGGLHASNCVLLWVGSIYLSKWTQIYCKISLRHQKGPKCWSIYLLDISQFKSHL